MKFRRRFPGADDGNPLAAYLRRAGLISEALLAEQAQNDPSAHNKLVSSLSQHKSRLPISAQLDEMDALLHLLFDRSPDFMMRRLKLGRPPRRALLVALSGMFDRPSLQRAVAALLTEVDTPDTPADAEELLKRLSDSRATTPMARLLDRTGEAVAGILDGDAVLYLDGATHALLLTVPGGERRAIAEPQTERVIRGPREGLVESLSTNISLVRRRIRDERLRIDTVRIGRFTSTPVGLFYINGMCQPDLITEVKSRLGRIQIDGVIDSGVLEELIEDTPWTLFPLFKATERPDVVAASILEGRFAILVDGSPFALIAPTSFTDMMQAPEDYYERYPVATMLRFLRWGFAAVALLGPAFYVALTTFHPELLPTQFLLSVLAAREGVPFPAVVEAFMMEVTFEALREAGVRMPKSIGQAMSIVGALVIGQAAVQAGIVSAPTVIVVSITGIASFIIPKFSAAIGLRMLRFPMLLLAGTFGFYGVTLGVVVVLLHMMSLRSFGSPYYEPIAPLIPKDLDDGMIRAPHWANRTRPTTIGPLDPIRAAKGLKPGPGRRPAAGKGETDHEN